MEIKLNYSKSVVAFLDVLGFKQILKDKSKTENYFSSVTAGIGDLDKHQLKALLVSDSVVLKIPYENQQSVREMLIAVARIQSEMALKDIWLRGAVTIGDFDFQQNGEFQIVAGEALARAYEIESKFAKYPRVLLDPSLSKEMGLNRRQLLAAIRKDQSQFPQPICDVISGDDRGFILGGTVVADGLWVDYSYLLLSQKENILTIAKNIKKNLYEGQEHYEKYRWVQSYLWSSFGSSYYEKKYGEEYQTLTDVIANL